MYTMLYANKIIRFRNFPLLIILALSFAGCSSPRFEHAVIQSAKDRCPEEILGNWTISNKRGDISQISVFPRRDNWMDIVIEDNINAAESPLGVQVHLLEGYCVKIKKNHFVFLRPCVMNIRGKSMAFAEKDKFFFLVEYKIDKEGKLAVWLPSSVKFEELIKEGKIEGEISREGLVGDALGGSPFVTANSEALKELLSNNSEKYFWEESLIFRKSRVEYWLKPKDSNNMKD